MGHGLTFRKSDMVFCRKFILTSSRDHNLLDFIGVEKIQICALKIFILDHI